MLARRVSQLLPSATLATTAKTKQLKSQGVDVVNLAAGEPDWDTPSYIKDAGIAAIQQGKTKYTPTIGIEELRRAIAKKLQEENQLAYTPDQIVVSCGAKQAIFNVIQALCDEGDEAIFCAPYWVSYPEMVKLSQGKAVIIETDEQHGFRPTPEQLKRAITKKTKLVILNSPSNPTGAVLTRADLTGIAELAVRHQLWVISDEIYEHFIYDGLAHVSLASLNRDIFGRTIVVNGASKTFAMTGWRIGYAAGPKEVMEAASRMQDHSTSNPASVSQWAALAALTQPDRSEWLAKLQQEFTARRDRLVQGLSRVPRLSVWKPQGAFYVFCNISALGMPAQEAARRLLDEARVAVIPGEGFGTDRHIRLSFATSLAEIDKGIERISTWVERKGKSSSPLLRSSEGAQKSQKSKGKSS